MALQFAIDVFAVFNGMLSVSGWVIGATPIRRLELCSSGLPEGRAQLLSYGSIDSPDVAAQLGPAAATVRFAETLPFTATNEALRDAYLLVRHETGETEIVRGLNVDQQDPAANLTARFAGLLRESKAGQLLEVGSRARSQIVRRDIVPPGWGYTGFDVLDGPNVDMVGDAHDLSIAFPQQRFDAVMAFSVLEHLLMPWKFILELNNVLNVGAVGLFTTHQCWPVHDAPWDFWRYSDRAWAGLLNGHTGFEIVSAQMAEPAFIVAQRCHPITNFGYAAGGFLASNVLFRKTGPTRLEWKVSLGDVVSTTYPS